MLKARLRYYATLGRGNPSDFITQEAHARHGAVLLYFTTRDVVNDPMGHPHCCCLDVNFSRLRNSNAIHVFSDGSLAPKVVQIIESYNKLYAFFVI